MSDSSEDAEDPDALRRRLYAPGATEDDLNRYRAIAPTRPVADAERPATTPEPRRTRRPVVVALLIGVILLTAGVTAVTATQHRLSATPRPTRTTAGVLVAAQPLQISAATRDGFVRSLRSDEEAGLGRFLGAHPEAQPPQIRTVLRADSDERWGRGPASIELAPSPAADRGGRMTVILVTSVDSAARWAAYRDADRDDRPPYQGMVGNRGGQQQAGLPTAGTFAYDPPAPVRLDIAVAEDVSWGVLVDFTN